MNETNAERLIEIKDYYAHFLTRVKGIDYVLVSDLKWLIKQTERAQESKSELERLQEKERIYQIGDEWYRKKTEPIQHLWPLENRPGIGQIVEKFQSQLEEKERLSEALEEVFELSKHDNQSRYLDKCYVVARQALEELK